MGCIISSMSFVKSILCGWLSLIAVEILLLLALGIALILGVHPSKGTTVGIDIVSFAKNSPLTWVSAVLAFGLGFRWEHRRLKLRQAR